MTDGLAGLRALQRVIWSAGDHDAIDSHGELRLPAEYLLIAGYKP